jgi:hypothetical protein
VLDEILAKLSSIQPEKKAEIIDMALYATRNMRWVPNPGPQTEAYFCDADELFYGGCVSGDTEFLTASGWVRIDEYSGEQVAQWDNGLLSFVDPEYHQYPCKELIHFEHSRLSMMLSDDHRMPLYDWKGEFCVKKAADVAKKPSRHRVPVNYSVAHSGLDMSDDLIRLAVAIHADGSLTPRKDGGAHCRISLRKQRKIDRLLWLFDLLDIKPSVYRNPNRPTEVRYGFDSPILTKHFVDSWWLASQKQLEIILEEMSYWDGDYSGVIGGDIKFCSTHKIDADFIQYAANACNRVATIGMTPSYGNASALYKVHISHEGNAKSTVTLRVDAVEITRVAAEEMFCFTVPSSFWLARHNNCVFVTGNSAGGGKSSLINGLAVNSHQRTLILRQFRDDAKKLAEAELLGMILDGNRDGWNGSDLVYRKDGVLIQYGGCDHEEDKQRFKGDPHDLICFDEVTDFSESQYKFINIWNRSSVAGQRCRIVATGNPPTTAAGLWVVHRWAAWLDQEHQNPAKPGELRWYVSGPNDEDIEVDGRGPHYFDWNDRGIVARSRTFIKAKLSDNPDLMDDGHYESMLDSLPDELRQAYRDGYFKSILNDQPKQLIKSAWVKAANDRWENQPPDGVPMCAMGVDVAQGGSDSNVIAARYDGWYAPLIKIAGKETPLGTDLLGPIMAARRNNAKVILDVGGGYGSDTYKALIDNNIPVKPHKGAMGSHHKSLCGLYTFYNYRTEVYYRFMEALNPSQEGGSRIALPPDSTLFADLTSILFTVERSPLGLMIKLESKEKLCARIGRSTDCGDPVVNAWSDGDKIENSYQSWQSNKVNRNLGRRPVVLMSKRK